ncbi:MAG: hypothetical protein AB7V14_10435 [Kiritimatiellia bacterium]
MTKKLKSLRGVGVLVVLLGVYPAMVLMYTWSCVLRSDLRGGRHGPLDAYRHALASSVVSYTLNESAVNLITVLFESKGKASNRMDSHNNRIGASLGTRAASFRDLEPTVRQSVLNGAVDAADLDQITWLPENKWRDGWIW